MDKLRPPKRIQGRNDRTYNRKEKKQRMSFRMSHDVYLFLQSQLAEGRNQTAMVERAIREVYFKDGTTGKSTFQ